MKFYVCYWCGSKLSGLPWEHNTEIDDLGMGLKQGMAIIEHIVSKGYNAMIRKHTNESGNYVILIDSGRFTQR